MSINQEYLLRFEEMTKNKGDIESVLLMSSTLEKALRYQWGAEGEGLGQMVRNLRGHIGDGIAEDIKRFAELRNKAAHEPEKFRLASRQRTIRNAAFIYTQINNPPKSLWLRRIRGSIARGKWELHTVLWLFFPLSAIIYIPWIAIQQSNGRWRNKFVKSPLAISCAFYMTSLAMFIGSIVSKRYSGVDEISFVAMFFFVYFLVCAALGRKMASGLKSC